MSIPKYINTLCNNNLKFNNAPYEYIIYQNKHIPSSVDSLISKIEKLEKFILSHNGEFTVLTEKPYIRGDNLCHRLFFNCAVVTAKEIDRLIEGVI